MPREPFEIKIEGERIILQSDAFERKLLWR